MTKKIIIASLGMLIGIALGIYFIYFIPKAPKHTKAVQKQVIGFLPYWLLNRAQTDYSNDITTLTYFGLRIDGRGHIIKLTSPREEDPGWHALSSGKLNPFFTSARQNHVKLSLLIASGGSDAINQLLTNPVKYADNLIQDVTPLMNKYHFSDLNLDIEYSGKASSAAQLRFTQFVKTVKQQMTNKKLGTVTVEISPLDAVEKNLINIKAVAKYADDIVLMAYDYHSTISYVTGPVAPLNGAGVSLEYDVATAVEKSLQFVPPQKLILGMPLYGYEWETLNNAIRSAVIPGSSVLASNDRMQSLLAKCATCSAFFDNKAKEEYVVYKDPATGTYHEISYPTQQSMVAKLTFAEKEQLGGVALWALGYEGNNILSPLTYYKN